MAANKATSPSKSKAKTKASAAKGAHKSKPAAKAKKVAAKGLLAKKSSPMTSVSKKAKATKPAAKILVKAKQELKAKPVSHDAAEKAKQSVAKPVTAKASAVKPAAVGLPTTAQPLPHDVVKTALGPKVLTAAKPLPPKAMAPVAGGAPGATAPVPGMMSAASMPPKAAAVAPKVVIAPKVVVAEGIAQAAKKQQAQKQANVRNGFKTNEFIVYPAHGVGRIVAIEEQEIAGIKLELFVIQFEKDKMTLRVPTGKCQSIGMRKLAEDGIVKRAMETLKGRARIKRTMWSRRAQEYEAKINSGDLVAIAEVVRDLYRAENQPEQSYSERQLYEAALDRMAREIAAVDKIDERGAVQKIVEVLSRSAKARKPVGEDAATGEAGDVKAA